MTNKEKAIALMAQVDDQDLSQAARQEAWNAINQLKQKSKTSFEKLGVTADWRSAAETSLLNPIAHSIAEVPFHIAADPLDEGKPNSDRGLISAMVRDRLENTTQAYAQIVEDVRTAFPAAKTTTRSVASVASDLRKAGRIVPQRGNKA